MNYGTTRHFADVERARLLVRGEPSEATLVRAAVRGDRLALSSRDDHLVLERVLRVADTRRLSVDHREDCRRRGVGIEGPDLVLHVERLRRRLQRAVRRARVAGEERQTPVGVQLGLRERPDAGTRQFHGRVRHVDDVPAELARDRVGRFHFLAGLGVEAAGVVAVGQAVRVVIDAVDAVARALRGGRDNTPARRIARQAGAAETAASAAAVVAADFAGAGRDTDGLAGLGVEAAGVVAVGQPVRIVVDAVDTVARALRGGRNNFDALSSGITGQPVRA